MMVFFMVMVVMFTATVLVFIMMMFMALGCYYCIRFFLSDQFLHLLCHLLAQMMCTVIGKQLILKGQRHIGQTVNLCDLSFQPCGTVGTVYAGHLEIVSGIRIYIMMVFIMVMMLFVFIVVMVSASTVFLMIMFFVHMMMFTLTMVVVFMIMVQFTFSHRVILLSYEQLFICL